MSFNFVFLILVQYCIIIIVYSGFLQRGLTIEVDGQQHTFYGSVLVTLCDTLGAHQLGGFKEGVGFSLRKCRDCMATQADMQTKVNLIFIQLCIHTY